MQNMICQKCKKEFEIEKIFRQSTCPFCGADLHSCKNCEFYSKESHYDCRENIEENISDKERANFCDFFRSKNLSIQTTTIKNSSQKSDAKKIVAKLFGEDENEDLKTVSNSCNAKKSFEALFQNL